MDRDKLCHALNGLYDLVAKLRGPGGCPWDARQTEATVRMYLLEEAYEVLDASENGLTMEVCQELGDLLFQILFLAYMGEEKGSFDLVEVVERIHEKMVKRHPHVFGSEKVRSAEEVSQNWARIKGEERGEKKEPASLLRSVPLALPALLRAHRLSERVSGTTWKPFPSEGPWVRTRAAFTALEKAVEQRDEGQVGPALGRLLFDLADLARAWGRNAEDLLRETNQDFIRRFDEENEAGETR